MIENNMVTDNTPDWESGAPEDLSSCLTSTSSRIYRLLMSASSKQGNPKRIKEIRSTLGWSQRKFAEALGVRLNTVYRWESGILSTPIAMEYAAEYLLLINQTKKGE